MCSCLRIRYTWLVCAPPTTSGKYSGLLSLHPGHRCIDRSTVCYEAGCACRSPRKLAAVWIPVAYTSPETLQPIPASPAHLSLCHCIIYTGCLHQVLRTIGDPRANLIASFINTCRLCVSMKCNRQCHSNAPVGTIMFYCRTIAQVTHTKSLHFSVREQRALRLLSPEILQCRVLSSQSFTINAISSTKLSSAVKLIFTSQVLKLP